jgi:hypothetical protein
MRCLGFVFLLPASSLSAQTSVVPDIQYRSVPDFLRMPADLYFGEVSGVAVNSRPFPFRQKAGENETHRNATQKN